MSISGSNRIAPWLAALATTLACAGTASAQTFCVFDLLGAQGDVYNIMKDYQIEASKWGANLQLKAYSDEKVASEEFKAGQCDGVLLTGLRARAYNPFTGSLDSLGGLPNYKVTNFVLSTLEKPSAAKYMVMGNYEVAGILPAGAIYLFMNDRSINNVSKLAGKKIAYFDYDRAQPKMIQKIGAQGVASDITNFAGKFNNGSVEVVGAPAIAFKPLELFKGLGSKGAIARFPVLQLSYQIIVRKDKFPEGFGQKSRDFASALYPRAMSLVSRAEGQIENNYWMDISQADTDKYFVLLRDSRISLTSEGIYDKKMLHVLREARCHVNPADAECAQELE